MRFYEVVDMYSAYQKSAACKKYGRIRSREVFYGEVNDRVKSESVAHWRHARYYKLWNEHRRPFYNCWPEVLSIFDRIRLDGLTFGQLQLPEAFIACRMPSDAVTALGGRFWCPQLFLGKLANGGLLIDVWVDSDYPGIELQPITIECGPGWECGSFSWIDTVNGQDGLVHLEHEEADFKRRIQKAAVGVCLISQSDGMLQRVLLNRDKHVELDGERYDKAVQRAINRGVNGWDLGRDLPEATGRESPCAHYRRSTFMLSWTGKGKTVPRIVPRQGGMVNAKQMTKVPTGYLGVAK